MFTKHMASPWVEVDRMEKWFYRLMEWVDVESVRKAVEKVERTQGDDSKRLRKLMEMVRGLYEDREE